jgi:hypothetical protein
MSVSQSVLFSFNLSLHFEFYQLQFIAVHTKNRNWSYDELKERIVLKKYILVGSSYSSVLSSILTQGIMNISIYFMKGPHD